MNTDTNTVNDTAVDTVVKAKGTKATKRKYVKRGTTVLARRVTLLDGVPVGRGKPSPKIRSKRTVVYVPVGQAYDPAVHGLGVTYRPNLSQFKRSLKRLKIADLTYNIPGVTKPAVAA